MAGVAALGALILPPAAQADRAVLVTNSDSANQALSAFAANGGPLTPVGTPVAGGDDANGVVISPDARHAYVANTTDDEIEIYRLAESGAPTSIGSVPTGGNQPTGVGMSPDGAFLYATNRDSTDAAPRVSAFTVNAATGALTPVAGSPFDVGLYDPRAVVVAPDGRFAYVSGRRGPTGGGAGSADSGIAALAIGANGALSQVAGSPVFLSGLVGGFGLSMAPTGENLYMARSSGNVIHAFAFNASGLPGQIPGSPFATVGNTPSELAVSPDGDSLYVAEVFGQSVEGFTINSANGTLASIAGTPLALAGQVRGVALAPDGGSAYVSLLADPGRVEGTAVGAGGALAKYAGSPYLTGGVFPNFFSVAVTPTQTPTPAFSAPKSGLAGAALAFDASATTVRGGEATRFDWDFGDGTTALDGGSTINHAYAADGTYTVKLTVTNDCAPDAVFTEGVVSVGSAVYCNGPRQAVKTRSVTVDSAVDGTVTAKRKQKQKKKKVIVKAKVKAGEKLTAKLSGKIMSGKKSYKLKAKTTSAKAGKTKKVKLKPKKKSQAKKILKALKRGKKPKVKLKGTLTDGVGNKSKTKLKVKLKK